MLGKILKSIIFSVVSLFISNNMSLIFEIVVVEASEKEVAQGISGVPFMGADFFEEELRSQQALVVIEEKYAESSQEKSNINDIEAVHQAQDYTLTAEDEARMNQAVSEYLQMVKYNPRLRGVGRKWWNTRNFVGSVLDVACVALGFGAGVRSAASLMKVVKANRKNITRAIEKQLRVALGLSIGSAVSKGLDMVSAITGVSLGYAIAWGIDYVDGRRLDGYIFA